jgi:drug/metabolite transporter (DMT)-like permease
MPSPKRPAPWMVILAFGLVYLFWGSTYLAIDIAVQTIPPALMCAVRFSIAGIVMLAVCALTGRRIFYSPRQIALCAVVGVLLLMGGNLTLSYAELTVSSGLAALIIAITPLWFLVLDQLLLGDHHISRRGKAGLLLGILGLFVLVWPQLQAGSMGHREFWASVSLIAGSFTWALGSVLSKRWQSGMDVFSATGWQVTAAGVGNLIFALFDGDLARVHWTARCHDVPGGLRLLDRLYRLHLAARTRAHVESFHLRVCESGSGCFFGMADSAREGGPLHSRGKRHRCAICNSRDQR